MSSLALDIYLQLLDQVLEVEEAAKRSAETGHLVAEQVLRRSGLVLAVAAIDTYFHEQGATLLVSSASLGATDASRVATYLGRTAAADVSGSSAEGHIRLGLSYKTLVAPTSIDSMLTAAGKDAAATWLQVAFALGSRPDRVRLQLQVIYDRRNQIAHEGDWDRIQLEFRSMKEAHLADCVRNLTALAEAVDPLV